MDLHLKEKIESEFDSVLLPINRTLYPPIDLMEYQELAYSGISKSELESISQDFGSFQIDEQEFLSTYLHTPLEQEAPALLNKLKEKYKKLAEAFSKVDPQRLSPVEVSGYEISLPFENSITSLKQLLIDTPYTTFIGEKKLRRDSSTGRYDGLDCVGYVFDSLSNTNIVRLARTNGLQYFISTEDIVRFVEKWDEISQLDIRYASRNELEFTVGREFEEERKFAEDLCELCPVDLNAENCLEAIHERIPIFLYWEN
jgi:hypothetical protein